MAEGSNGRRRFSDKWGKHELDVLAVLSSAFPQWLTSRQIAQRVKAYADSYGELADQAAKAAFAKQFQRDRAKLAAMGIAIESRQPEYSSKSEGQDFASYRLQLGNEPRVRMQFEQEDLSVLATANYLARSLSVSSRSSRPVQQANRTAPRVPQTPIPGLGLDSIAPGLGTQRIPDTLLKAIDSHRFAATIDVDGEYINVAYTDSDDLATFVLEHPGAIIVSPQEAADAYYRRLNAASNMKKLDEIKKTTTKTAEDDNEELKLAKKTSSFQTGSEVDRRLRLMLFLSAHLGEEFSIAELAQRFIGRPKSEDELRKFINILNKDIDTITTVSDDGEMAGSQFFDIDFSLLEAEGIVSATNSLGLERLAGISQQYLSMLTASVNYLAHSPLLPAEQRSQALSLYERMQQHVKPGDTPWLSLTGYENEPRNFDIVRRAVSENKLLLMEYIDAAGLIHTKLVAPSKLFVEEGLYYVAVWTDVNDYAPKDHKKFINVDNTINKATGKPRIWQILRVSRIEKGKIIEPTKRPELPQVALGEFHEWSIENGTHASFITNKRDLPFVQELTNAKVEPYGDGEKVDLTVVSDSWFVAFCIAHARNIVAVSPETLRSMIIARATRELSVDNDEQEDEA
ncbi:MAG: WYL domain-containing protein [Bifidobacteriaceae bacterium]|nr:WYL domain-containing protein [Bifidobacteriaceae bacterium]